MADFGVTIEGFQKMRLSDIKSSVETTLRATLGNGINLLDQTVFGQVVGVFSDREASLWEMAEDVFNSGFPDSSDGIPLDNVASITNVRRLPAKASIQLGQILFGTVGSTIPAGTQFSVPGSSLAKFKTNNDVVLVLGADEVQLLNFNSLPAAGSFALEFINEFTGLIPYNATAQNVADALNGISKLGGVTVTGSFAAGFVINFSGNSGKQKQPLLIVNSNTLLNSSTVSVQAVVAEQTAGIPQGQVNATATATGAIAAPAYSLVNIDTPVSGLTRTLNQTDAAIGRDIETDNALKIRRRTAQTGQGKGTTDALRAALLALTGVTAAIIFENDTDATDANALPPHSFKAFVEGGADQDIWDTIWVYKPMGIPSQGSHVGNHVDTQGQNQTVKFERPVQVPIFINLALTTDDTLFPTNGDQLAKDYLYAYVNALAVGADVNVYPGMIAAISSIPGITGLQIGVGRTPNPAFGAGAAGITIAINEIAQIVNETTDITVTST